MSYIASEIRKINDINASHKDNRKSLREEAFEILGKSIDKRGEEEAKEASGVVGELAQAL